MESSSRLDNKLEIVASYHPSPRNVNTLEESIESNDG